MRVELVRADGLDVILPLIEGYQRFYHCVPDRERNLRHFTAVAGNETLGVLFGAFDGDRPVGFATLYFPLSTTRADRFCLMNDLYAVPECRGEGVGRALIGVCRDYASEHGFPDLVWNTQAENEIAQILYDSVGGTYTSWRRYTLPTR